MILANKDVAIEHRRWEAPESRSKKRVKPQRVTGKHFLRVMGIIMALFLIALLYTYQYTKSIALGYQVQAASDRIDALQQGNRSLELKVAQLQAPERVEDVAVNKLGMIKPDNYLLATSTTVNQNNGQKPGANSDQGNAIKHLVTMISNRLVPQAEASP